MASTSEPSSPQPLKTTTSRSLTTRYVAYMRIYTWAWFLIPMTTVGYSTLISAQLKVKNFHGLYTIGLVFYFIGLMQFVLLAVTKPVLFWMHPGSLWASLQAPSESMFHATFWISIYGILGGAIDFSAPKAGSSLALAFHAFFWIYLACALTAGIGLHVLIVHKARLKDVNMTPAWLLPVLPIILIGVLAGTVLPVLNRDQYCPVMIGGLLSSSMGILLSIAMAALYLHRLFVYGFPDLDSRPAMFIAIGPPAFAPLAYLKIVKGLSVDPQCLGAQQVDVHILQTMTLIFSIGLYGLAFFFLLLALSANLAGARSMKFHLTWYGFIFPNVGLMSTMGIIAQEISSSALKWVTTAGTAILAAVWIFVTLIHLRVLITKAAF